MVGTFGTFAAFSFYPTKNMTSGEGGMITTSDPEVARNCQLLRNQGMEKRYANELVGLNNRMTDIHAAIGRVQLAKVAEWTRQRQENAKFLDQNLEGVVVPAVAEGATHVYHQYTIRLKDRDGVQESLKNRGVQTMVYYPVPLHLQKVHDYLGCHSGDFPISERAAREVLSLPIFPELTLEQQQEVAEALRRAVEDGIPV